MTTSEKIFAIFAQVRREMNGAVAGAMSDRGVRYNLNYGVSLPTIRDIAAPYAPDHDLAEALWRQDVREMKIAAIFVDDPSMVTRGQMEKWLEEAPTGELAELAAMNLFWRVPQGLFIAGQWLPGGCANETFAATAFYMAGKLAGADADNGGEAYMEKRAGAGTEAAAEIEKTTARAAAGCNTTAASRLATILSDEKFIPFIRHAEHAAIAGKAVVYAMREIYRHRPALRGEIGKMLERLSSDPASQELAEELKWQLEYL